jgi:2-polyprenyl-3-methyl-5-hydroxy-6-metoxy-1,4-benzoquinol methylase
MDVPRRFAARFRRWFLGDRLVDVSRAQDPDRILLDPIRLNIKNFGYQLARDLAPRLASVDPAGEPRDHGLGGRPTTQADMESPWFAHWCQELRIAPIYHRKLWEFAFVLQVLSERGRLRPGLRGIGFGCGEEPLASYLASRGITVTVTDLDPAQSVGRGWVETGQHTSALDQAFKPELVDRDRFEELVKLEYVDMNGIPSSLEGRHDFCWSICAFEHLGSIENGLRFVENAMRTLKPGGVAVHTTEFNYLSEDETVESGSTVLFLRKHFVELKRRLEASGHEVGELDFSTGGGVLDRFIDVPPYAWDGASEDIWGPNPEHLKMTVGRFPCTCYGLIVRRGS